MLTLDNIVLKVRSNEANKLLDERFSEEDDLN